MTTWQGLNAEEIASITRDEYCFQKIERILRERNEVKDFYPDVTFEDGVFRFDLPNGDEFVIVPPKPRELSDEEIREVAKKYLGHSMGLLNWHSFAKAILKKARDYE
jgi:hypothetical protein